MTRFLPLAVGGAAALGSAWLFLSGAGVAGPPLRPETSVSDALEPARSSRDISALRADPASAARWVQLGQALFASREFARARYCFARAVELAPHSPPVLLDAASFAHAAGRPREGLRLMARVLAATRQYDELIFSFYARASDAQSVLTAGLPNDPEAARAWFAHLLDAGDYQAAAVTWNSLARGKATTPALLSRYVLALLEGRLYEQAFRIFQASLPALERSRNGEPIVHGGFETESTRAPLDWVVADRPGVTVRRDDQMAHSGRWSLRLDFDGQENIEYRHVAQQVVAPPGAWMLRAFVRTRSVTTDEGLGLRVFDKEVPSRLSLRARAVLGDSDWVPVEAEVPFSGEFRRLQVEIVRRPSKKFRNKLSGTVWVDDVSLTRSGRAGGTLGVVGSSDP